MPSEEVEAEFDRVLEAYMSDLVKQGFTKRQAMRRAIDRAEAMYEATIRQRRAALKIVE